MLQFYNVTMSDGFTLIEILIVIGILAVIVASATPLTLDFYNSRQLDLYEQSLVQHLRKAQIKAIESDNDSAFGVYLNSDKYVLFQGSSYADRDEAMDEEIDLPDNLEISGINQVVFSKLSGEPSQTGEIKIDIAGEKEAVNINEMGVVDY